MTIPIEYYTAGILILVWAIWIFFDSKHNKLTTAEFDDTLKTHGPNAMTEEDMQIEKDITEALKDNDTIELREKLNIIHKENTK